MNNKLKKYYDFLNEASKSEKLPARLLSSSSREDYLKLRCYFHDAIDLVRLYYDTYFSNLCAGSGNDPDVDYLEMKNLLSRTGWTMESIKNLFSPEVDKVCKYNFFNLAYGEPSSEIKMEMNTRRTSKLNDVDWLKFVEIFKGKSLTDTNGYIDLYMYKLVEELSLTNTFNYSNEDKIYLGGEGWHNQTKDNDEGVNEYMIKCAYGYHQTKYGKLFLKQAGISEKELIENAIRDFQDWFETEWMSIIDNMITGTNGRDISSKMSFKDFFLVENDRIVIFCKSISEYLIESKLDISTEEVIAGFFKSLSIFKLGTGESPLDIEVVNKEDIIIWGEFVEFR